MFKNLQTKNQLTQRRSDNLDTKEKILDLYYKQHLKQNEIAKIIGTSNQYVSKIVKADNRIKLEKEQRKLKNKENRAIYLQKYFKTYIRSKKEDTLYKALQELQKQDALELSYRNNSISDYDFAKWNLSAYHTNKKGNLVLKRNIIIGFDVPKSVNMALKF